MSCESICENTTSWVNGYNFSNNNLCPPYPECSQNYFFSNQDTSECIECSEYIGDFNSDTNVDILDILVLVICIIDGECETCSDLNEDGNNDILDTHFVRQ